MKCPPEEGPSTVDLLEPEDQVISNQGRITLTQLFESAVRPFVFGGYMGKRRIVGIIAWIILLFVFASVFLVGSIIHTKKVAHQLETFVPTEGICVDYKIESSWVRSGASAAYPICGYDVNGKAVVSVTQESMSGNNGPAIGEKIKIRYNPENPKEYLITSYIKSYRSTFFYVSAILMYIAIVLLIIRCIAICTGSYQARDLFNLLMGIFIGLGLIMIGLLMAYIMAGHTFSIVNLFIYGKLAIAPVPFLIIGIVTIKDTIRYRYDFFN